MGKIFVHIGLPKTASSSLQIDYFPKLKEYDIQYLGVNQPRNSDDSSLFIQFMKSVNLGKEIEITKSMLKEQLLHQNLIISEEMIVVSTTQIGWKEKIQNMYKIIDSFEFIIIVSVREPISAMFSYYAELYSKYRKLNKSFEEIVFSEESMEIYHYQKFFNYLNEFFNPQRIRIVQFENIIKNDLKGLNTIFDIEENAVYHIGNHNVKKRSTNKIIKKHELNFGKVVLNLLTANGIYSYLKESRLYSIFRKIFLILNKLVVMRSFKVEIPNDDEMNKIRKKLKPEIKYLNDNFKIDYILKIDNSPNKIKK